MCIHYPRATFGDSSVLHFTCKIPHEGTLPFLDVKVKQQSENLTTKVHRKPTNIGLCLNGDRECSVKYKSFVIAANMRRAITHCSSWNDVHQELDFVAHQLVDNGCTNRDINCITRRTLHQWYAPEEQKEEKRKRKLFYMSRMNAEYKKDEAIFLHIINQNAAVTDPVSEISLIIYYQNKRTSQLLTKNSPQECDDPLKNHSVVYQFSCPANGCNYSYIGMTAIKLLRGYRCTCRRETSTSNLSGAMEICEGPFFWNQCKSSIKTETDAA